MFANHKYLVTLAACSPLNVPPIYLTPLLIATSMYVSIFAVHPSGTVFFLERLPPLLIYASMSFSSRTILPAKSRIWRLVRTAESAWPI